MYRHVTAVVVALLLASPALAGSTINFPAESAYAPTGGCTMTGVGLNGRTVPQCDTTTDGTFFVRGFTGVLAGAAQFIVQEIRFQAISEPSGTSDVHFAVACSALVEGTTAITFGTDATVTKDLDGDTDCNDINEICKTEIASATTAIWNTRPTAANCATTVCNNADMVCRVSYEATPAASDDTVVNVLSIKMDTTNP